MPHQAVLRVESLTIGTRQAGRGNPLVRDIDFGVARGQAVGIVGESGSGKSLTALSIAGLLPPNVGILSGRIHFEGTVISELPEPSLHTLRGKEIGYVFQDPLSALNPTLTIGRQLFDVLQRHTGGRSAVLRERTLDALRMVGIKQPKERMRSYPHELSGGMRQRALIAMAMLCTPKLLIADEPTTALDVTVQARIVDLFRDIRTSGVSLIFISHNLDLVLEFCDRLIVMYGGRIMETGTAYDIAESPHHPYTRALLDCVPRLGTSRRRLNVIEGQPPTQLGAMAGCPFAPRCPRVEARCRTHMPPLEPASATSSFACWNPHQRLRRAG